MERFEGLTRKHLISMVINDVQIRKMGLPKYKIEKICRTFLDVVNYSLISMKEGEKMEIRGIGTFSVRRRKAYMAHNPQTMKRFECKESLVLSFKTGKLVKEVLKKKRIKRY